MNVVNNNFYLDSFGVEHQILHQPNIIIKKQNIGMNLPPMEILKKMAKEMKKALMFHKKNRRKNYEFLENVIGTK